MRNILLPFAFGAVLVASVPRGTIRQAPAFFDYNDEFAKTAEQCASRAGVKIGDATWIRYGDYLKPEATGGHPSEGWNRSHLFSDPATLDRALWITLSNLHARPHAYAFAPVRMVAYELGERPSNWKWSPNVPRDSFDGGLRVADVLVYGADSEHFLYEPAFSAAEITKTFPLDSFCTWNGEPLKSDTRSWLAVGVKLVQWSCVGEIRAWANNKLSTGLPARAPDRVTHRLLYALTRSAQLQGLDGQDSVDAQAWLAAMYAQELADGPSVQTSKIIATTPQVSLPYFNPTQSYGYGIPAWYWADKFTGTTAHLDLVKKWSTNLVQLVGDDGSMPWAVDSKGVLGYFTPADGDKYTPGFENYTALRIADIVGIAGAAKKAQAILDRFHALPTGDQREFERGWFVDADRKLVP